MLVFKSKRKINFTEKYFLLYDIKEFIIKQLQKIKFLNYYKCSLKKKM